MKNIITTAILPLLAGLAFSCSSSTALQSTESDDLYYASTDRTVYPGQPTDTYSSNAVNPDAGEVANPEYAGGNAAPSMVNNYNYYDSDGYNSRRYSGSRYRNYNYYSYDPFYDPYYSPFGYSAAYCYNLYDPFWYPYCYPSGFSISIGYSWGYPGYGYYGYRPYGYGYPYNYYGYGYGGGYGSYYHGFYDGYYAGSGYGYGYRRVNYGPRTNRSNVPSRVPTGENTGRPASPGRVAQSDPNAGTVIPGTRPHRVAQPGTSSPGQAGQPPANQPPQNGRQETGRPAREIQVKPENYQFQQNAPQQIDYSRPVRDNATMPSQPGRAPVQDVTPAQQAPAQMEQSGRRQRNRSQSQPNYQPAEQRSTPVYENSRPSRGVNNGSGGSFQSPGRGSSGSGMPGGGGGGGGRPRR